jgi:hypothetical protein
MVACNIPIRVANSQSIHFEQNFSTIATNTIHPMISEILGQDTNNPIKQLLTTIRNQESRWFQYPFRNFSQVFPKKYIGINAMRFCHYKINAVFLSGAAGSIRKNHH